MVNKNNKIYLNLINKYTIDTKDYYMFEVNLECNQYFHILQRLMLILYNVFIIYNINLIRKTNLISKKIK